MISRLISLGTFSQPDNLQLCIFSLLWNSRVDFFLSFQKSQVKKNYEMDEILYLSHLLQWIVLRKIEEKQLDDIV